MNGRISAAPSAQFKPTLNTHRHTLTYTETERHTDRGRDFAYTYDILHSVPSIITFAKEKSYVMFLTPFVHVQDY